jgi:AcrR family transcriptional regulator
MRFMERDRYHHGDLRQALIAAAVEVVEQGGPEAVSLRDLAKSLGVSRAAPYRHFADREALLVAVAAEGYAALGAAYDKIAASGLAPRDAARANCRAYLDFAAQRPGMFRLMTESEVLSRDDPPVALIGPANAAFRSFSRIVAAAMPHADERTVAANIITGWSMLYGFVVLRRARMFKEFMTGPLTDEEMVEAVLDAVTGVR